jgi:hypothetical protein
MERLLRSGGAPGPPRHDRILGVAKDSAGVLSEREILASIVRTPAHDARGDPEGTPSTRGRPKPAARKRIAFADSSLTLTVLEGEAHEHARFPK